MEISDAKTAIAWHEEILKRTKALPEYLRRFSDLGQRFGDRKFSTLDLHIDKKALNSCKKYAEDFSSKRWHERNGLILSGPVGVGKHT